MIDRILNQIGSVSNSITPLEKVNPAQPIEDNLTKPNQDIQQKKESDNDIKKMKEVVKGINDFLQPTHTSIKFVLHDKLNDYYVTVVDDNTKEVIKEIPSKKLLDTYASMMEFVGILVDKKI